MLLLCQGSVTSSDQQLGEIGAVYKHSQTNLPLWRGEQEILAALLPKHLSSGHLSAPGQGTRGLGSHLALPDTGSLLVVTALLCTGNSSIVVHEKTYRGLTELSKSDLGSCWSSR